MSADIAYRLLVDMSARGSLSPELDKVGAKAKSVDSVLKGIGSSAANVGRSIADSFSGAVEAAAGVAMSLAKIGAVGVGAGIAYGVVHLNNELEKTQISIGAILNAQGVSSNMGEGMAKAAELMKNMRKDARDLPGELKDLQMFFKLGATPAFQLGATPERLEKISALGMAAAASTGVQMDQAAREMAQLLQGHAGGHNVFGSQLGFTAQNFNHLTGEERLKALEKALGKYEKSIEVFGGSFDALSSTMTDNAKQTLQKATAPLFDHVKQSMVRTNKYFDDHRDQIEHFAEKVGDKLAYAFEYGRMKLKEWTPVMKSFGDHAAAEFDKIWERAKPLVLGLEKLAKGGLASGGLFKGLEGAGLAYGGIKAAKIAAPLMSGATSLLGGGEAAAGFAGLAAGGVAAGAAAAAALVPLLAAAGAFHAVTDASSDFHEAAARSAEEIGKNTTKTFEHTAKIWEKVGPIATSMLDLVGTVWLGTFEMMSIGVEKATSALSKLTDTVYDLAKRTLVAHGIMADTPDDPGKPAARAAAKNFTEMLMPELDRDEKKTKKGAGGGGGGTTIHKVEIVVSSNQDPSRIARLTVDRLQDVSRFPTSSPRVRNWSAERP